MGGAVEIGLLLGSMAVKEFSQYEVMREKRRALDLLRTQEQVQAEEEGVQRENKLEKVLGTQRAEGAARGVKPTSASLAVISEDTFDEFAQDERAANLNLKVKEVAIDEEKENAKRGFILNTAGNLFSAANRFNDLRVPSPPGDSSGSEVDAVMQNYTITGEHPQDTSIGGEGPLDLTKHNQEEINDFIGF